MKMGFGKHKDKTVEQVLLGYPDYIGWLETTENPQGPALRVLGHVKDSLIPKFDSKPLIEHCSSGCGKTATYATGYQGNPNTLYFWCNNCDPHSSGAVPGRLTFIRNFKGAVTHGRQCGSARENLGATVRAFAEVKGLRKRLTKIAAEDFFK